ncbi:TBC domain-containing protein kinase-like protein [Apostichopus japonicus]|uniref:TBC domain-containing protein kinase-like protein n=1 Tax=Stichopus japonicus TaxID=307972 RepID=UPI003AB41F99
MQPLGNSCLGVSTFFASSHADDQCGADGLPLTPNSIKVQGRFQWLKVLYHPRLCQYLDLVRGKHERLILVTEHYKKCLAEEAEDDTFTDENNFLRLAYETIEGLAHIHDNGFVHRNLHPKNILLDTEGRVKLSNYAVYYITGCGADVNFPVGYPAYMAPEVLMAGPSSSSSCPPSGPKSDVWSLGVILLEVALKFKIWPNLSLPQLLAKILLLGKYGTSQHPLDSILKEHSMAEKFENLPLNIRYLIRLCLELLMSNRPSAKDLLKNNVFGKFSPSKCLSKSSYTMFQCPGLRCEDLEVPQYIEDIKLSGEEDYLAERSLKEVYYLWGLAGGDLENELRKHGFLQRSPPICSLPNLVTEYGDILGLERDRSSLYDDTVITLSLDQLRKRLEHIPPEDYYPLIEGEEMQQMSQSQSSNDLKELSQLPLVIREKDIDYQLHRIVLFDRLLKGYPHTIQRIKVETRRDMPPLYRAEAWAAILEVSGDFMSEYDAIDKESPLPIDSQLLIDIRRCHQYDEILYSPKAHSKLKRILKCWLISNPRLVYWQGQDSVCAPFLYLNFNNEALAFACCSAFIRKYLHKFYASDNSAVLDEYLAVFSHLIAFHDPELSNHMRSISLEPKLFATKWFLTMFAHVFPLHKIFHLYDTLLLGNSSFPLCVGVAILQQMRDYLLMEDFSACILIISDMPEIDIERCVQDSIRIFCHTPKSATYRQHSRPPAKKEDSSIFSMKQISYYTTDVNEMPRSELSREPLSLEELQAERCPRISAEDLLELCGLTGIENSRSPTRKSKSSKPIILILDIRNSEDFSRGHIPSSINMPFNQAFAPEGDLVPCHGVTQLNSHKGRVVVVVGNRGNNAPNFAAQLVMLGYPKVSVMHGGIECLKATGILSVSSPDL